jgi:hypothetical protein
MSLLHGFSWSVTVEVCKQETYITGEKSYFFLCKTQDEAKMPPKLYFIFRFGLNDNQDFIVVWKCHVRPALCFGTRRRQIANFAFGRAILLWSVYFKDRVFCFLLWQPVPLRVLSCHCTPAAVRKDMDTPVPGIAELRARTNFYAYKGGNADIVLLM